MQVALETERGEQLEVIVDWDCILDRALPSCYDESYPFLRHIDPYGDTVFNRLQMDSFLAEWKRLGETLQAAEERDLLGEIERLANQCQRQPHSYLKFYGESVWSRLGSRPTAVALVGSLAPARD